MYNFYIFLIILATISPIAAYNRSEILKDINLELTQAKVFTTEDGVHVFAKNQENEDVMRFKTLKITYK